MKLNRYPRFFECCKNASPSCHIDLQAMSCSDKDAFVSAYLRDCGGKVNEQLADLVDSLAVPEPVKNDAYASVELILLDLCQQYNDWLDVRFNTAFDSIFSPDKAMRDAGHKPSDFA